jgi:hypothetical protein
MNAKQIAIYSLSLGALGVGAWSAQEELVASASGTCCEHTSAECGGSLHCAYPPSGWLPCSPIDVNYCLS